jgi:hypothetical protein
MFAMMSSVFINAATATLAPPLTNNNIVLPDFIEGSIRIMYPDVSEEKLAEVRAQWIEQITLKERLIAETNDAILKPDPTTRASAHISSVTNTCTSGGGTLTNPSNIAGTSDGKFARFYTPSTDQCATVVGQMSATAAGNYYISAYRGGSSTGNYVVLWGSASGNGNTWVPIGYAQITSTGTSAYYVGYASTAYSYVEVVCTTYLGGLATYNDVYIDYVFNNY